MRSRARLDYAGVQADHRRGAVHPAIAALPELGRLRREPAVRRGAIELELPEQEVVPDGAGGWTVQVRQRLDVEAWNAEISLLTGMARGADHAGRRGRRAAHAARARARRAWSELRRAARDARARLARRRARWPRCWPACPRTPPHALALRRAATTLLRGAGYTRVRPAAGAAPPADAGHGGIGAPYAHVTAPLRRLVDRFGTEVCLAVTAGAELPEWLRAALPDAAGR